MALCSVKMNHSVQIQSYNNAPETRVGPHIGVRISHTNRQREISTPKSPTLHRPGRSCRQHHPTQTKWFVIAIKHLHCTHSSYVGDSIAHNLLHFAIGVFGIQTRVRQVMSRLPLGPVGLAYWPGEFLPNFAADRIGVLCQSVKLSLHTFAIHE